MSPGAASSFEPSGPASRGEHLTGSPVDRIQSLPVGGCFLAATLGTMKSNAFLLGGLVTIAVGSYSASALATFPGPEGNSGAPSVSAPGGATCNGCHGQATRPTISFTGPDSVQAGVAASFTLTGTGPATLRCLVATDMTITLTPTTTNSIASSVFGRYEIVPTNAGGAPCTFTLTARNAGTFRIYYALASAPGSPGGGAEGIGYVNGQKTITVTGGTPPVLDSGVPPVTDGGVPPRTDSGTPPVKVDGGGVVTPLSDGGSIITYPDGAVAPGPAQTPRGSSLTPADDEGGCNASGSPLSLSGIFAAGAVATFLLGSRRLARRRRS